MPGGREIIDGQLERPRIPDLGVRVNIERINLTNFRCFGPNPASIDLSPNLTAFIGANGSGKTAAFQALSRLFGVTREQRRLRRRDFHVPSKEQSEPPQRTLSIEAILGFPELRGGDIGALSQIGSVVPEFFHHMAVGPDGSLNCRLRCDAIWIDDGSAEGIVEAQYRAVRTLEEQFGDEDCINVPLSERLRIQMIYVSSIRDGRSQLESFLRGRIWQAIRWTEEFRETVSSSSVQMNDAFSREPGVDVVANAVRNCWAEVIGPNSPEIPDFHPVDRRFQEFIRRIEVEFTSGDAGRPLELAELGDGQRSLFHIAMSLSTIGIEQTIRNNETNGFVRNRLNMPALTLIALEEPENNLAPYYLSRIVSEIQRLIEGSEHAQTLLSSHSASLISRVPPDNVRHFQLRLPTRTSDVNPIELPTDSEDAGKYVRQAVRSFPELYFAQFVILGEGASESIVLPRISESLGFHIDQSFVAVVPLGGRHVNHFWKLLTGLGIPYVTLLDLDAGRHGGGWRRIKSVCEQLLRNGVAKSDLFEKNAANGMQEPLSSFESRRIDRSISDWVIRLRAFGVYLVEPLDLDMLMLQSYTEAYKRLPSGMTGPLLANGAEERAAEAVLGAIPEEAPYRATLRALFPWYRYLFLGRSKPDTHFRVMTALSDEEIRANAPEVLKSLLNCVREILHINAIESDTNPNEG